MAAAAGFLLPYLLGMFLGRTIDLTNYVIGGNIYDDSKYTEESLNKMNVTYYVIDSDTVPYDFFAMPVDIALRIKANQISSMSGALGLDGMLKDTSWMHNSAVVAISAVQRTVKRNLPENAELLNDWRIRIPRNQTHYASSVVFGGWFVLLFRFQCDIPSDVIPVRKTVLEVLGHSGPIKSNTLELWKLVQEKVKANTQVRGIVTVNSFVYSSVELPMHIATPMDIEPVIQQFPDVVGPVGMPLHMELKPLNEVDESYPQIKKIEEVKKKDLLLLDKMFDDLKFTRTKIIRWIQESDGIDEDEEVEVSNLLETIKKCLRTFFLLVVHVSLYKDDDRADIEQAFELYKNGLEDASANYYHAYLRLKEDIDMSCENRFHHGIKGLLKVYADEFSYLGDVGISGLKQCQRECTYNIKCKSIGFAETLTELDLSTGNYMRKDNQCWLYYRSTSTAIIHSPNGISGDIKVYDRLCL